MSRFDDIDPRETRRSRERAAEELRATPRRLSVKLNDARSGATKVKYNPAHEPRGRQPRSIRHEDTEVRYSAHSKPSAAAKPSPCKLAVFHGRKTSFGVYDKRGRKMQMFKSREAAARQQADCKRAAGIAGASTKKGKPMAKAKSGKRKVTNAQKRARGKYCVYSPTKKLFNCFKAKESAERVVAGMNKGWAKLCKRKGVAPKEGFTLKKG